MKRFCELCYYYHYIKHSNNVCCLNTVDIWSPQRSKLLLLLNLHKECFVRVKMFFFKREINYYQMKVETSLHNSLFRPFLNTVLNVFRTDYYYIIAASMIKQWRQFTHYLKICLRSFYGLIIIIITKPSSVVYVLPICGFLERGMIIIIII